MTLPPILVRTEEIVEFAAELEKHPVIAVDLEADSMHNYQEKVCLLQFSTPDKTLLIDPLEGGNTSRYNIAVDYHFMEGSEHDFQLQVFLTQYDFRLYSNFTFRLNDSINGDMIEQNDHRHHKY